MPTEYRRYTTDELLARTVDDPPLMDFQRRRVWYRSMVIPGYYTVDARGDVNDYRPCSYMATLLLREVQNAWRDCGGSA